MAKLLAGSTVEPCGGASLHVLDHAGWSRFAALDGQRLVGLFVADGRAHAMFDAADAPVFVGTMLVDGAYPALSPAIPEAAWFERVAAEQGKAVATGAIDTRPAIRHASGDAGWPRFIETEGEGLYQIAEGPIAGLIARPVHRRFTMDGSRIARLEHRHGYAHRDLAGIMHGKSPRAAARFAARIAGDATVAHATAFARAAEAASDCPAPPRAAALREVMLDLERITTDLAVLAQVLERAGHDRLSGGLGRARDAIAGVIEALFGHRLMMDVVVPGGLAVDVRGEALSALTAALTEASRQARRVGGITARHSLHSAADLAIGRARSVIALAASLVSAFQAAPEGIIGRSVPPVSAMGVGMAPSARGMVFHWVKLHDGQIADIAVFDPSIRLAAVLETVAVGREFEEFALISDLYSILPSAIDG